jgi:hypothetical protein
MAQAGRATVREAVAVLEDVDGLEAAVAELRAAGFAADEISLLATREAVERKLGRAYRQVEELEDEAAAPRAAFVSREELAKRERRVAGALVVLPVVVVAGTVVASAGAVAAAVFGTALAGATLGAALARFMEERHAAWLQEQLERGGLLLWVRTATPERERLALGILTRHAVHDVHVHAIPAPEPAGAPELGGGSAARGMGGMLP